ncbi:MAG: TRAP transporter small permease [Clostridiales Family XIII bacterium]|jgi:TRAP-type C4-dicarboxylate transport system permease small subunit|nr:TRAP transporter small permease [Clostridiales Family XIII bacterium]
MSKLLIVATKIWKVEAYVAWVFMFANVLLIIFNIVMRRFFGTPIFGSTEMIRYISLCAASFALAQNEWIDGNITMSLIHEQLPKKAAGRLKAITNTICAAVFILITYLLYMQTYGRFVRQDVSYDIQIPIWAPSLVFAVGFTFLTVSIIIKAILLWHAEMTGGGQIDFRALVVPKDTEAMES